MPRAEELFEEYFVPGKPSGGLPQWISNEIIPSTSLIRHMMSR